MAGKKVKKSRPVLAPDGTPIRAIESSNLVYDKEFADVLQKKTIKALRKRRIKAGQSADDVIRETKVATFKDHLLEDQGNLDRAKAFIEENNLVDPDLKEAVEQAEQEQLTGTGLPSDLPSPEEELSGFTNTAMNIVARSPVGKFASKVYDKVVKRVAKAAKKIIKKAAKWAVRAIAAVIGVEEIPGAQVLVEAVAEVVSRLVEWTAKKVKRLARDSKDLAIGVSLLALGALHYSTYFVIAAIGALLASIIIPIFIVLVGIPLLFVLILFIINQSAWVVPPGESANFFTIDPTLPDSAFIDVTKIASHPTAGEGPFLEFENSDLPLEVTYTITIIAEKSTLSNIIIDYSCEVTNANTGTPCPPDPAIPEPPAIISPTTPFTFSYTMTYNSPTYEDSSIADTILVTANAEGLEGEVSGAAASIRIGNPPDECPRGWPVVTSSGQVYYVNQGPGGTASHMDPNGWQEGVDIHPEGNVLDTSKHFLLASHSGVAYDYNHPAGGLGVWIEGTCNGIDFVSFNAHMSAEFIQDGQQVSAGDVIGIMGQTGSASSGPHIHYEFVDANQKNIDRSDPPPWMTIPYVPVNVPLKCVGRQACGITIQ